MRRRRPNKVALLSAALLLVSLVAVVALAKALTPIMEFGIEKVGAPKSVVGIIIAGAGAAPRRPGGVPCRQCKSSAD